MKKLLLVFLLFGLNIFLLADEQKHFKISYDPDYAPFSYNEDNKPRGFLIDVWKLWAKKNNYTIEFVDGKLWDDALDLAKTSQVDFFLGTEVYEDWMKGSTPIYKTKSSLFSLHNNTGKLSKDKNYTLGIIGSDYEDLMLSSFPRSTIKVYEDYQSVMDDLLSNDIDMIFDDKIAIEFYALQNRKYHHLKYINFLDQMSPIQAISNNDTLIKIFNEGLKKLNYEELIKIEKKWIRNNISYFTEQKNKLVLTKEEKEFIEKNIINISYSTKWKPFTFINENKQADGISTKYWQLIAKKLQLKTNYTPYNKFTEQLNSIKTKKQDIIYSTGETEDRKEYSNFTNPYLTFPISIATLKDENFIENIEQILDKKIAVGKNFTAHKMLKEKYPDLKLILANSIEDGLKLVDDKKAYAYIDIKPNITYNIQRFGFENIKATGNTGLHFDLRVMVRDDYPLLLSAINKAIQSITKQEMNSILVPWENIQFEKKFDYSYLWGVLAIITVIVGALVIKNIVIQNANEKLKKLVDERTKELQILNDNLEKMVDKKTKELLEKETLLTQQSKMAAMGEMLENIAHQWRQPLSSISTNASTIQMYNEIGDVDKEMLDESMESIDKASQYLSKTIDDFRGFFKQSKERSDIKAKNLIDRCVVIINSQIKKNNIEIIENIENLHINTLENELIQVFMNLFKNSIDALSQQDQKQNLILIDIYKNKDQIVISFKDNGGGIKEDILDRIFEPYFTTKHKAQGTGIGLYMSFEIVSKHLHGTLKAENISFDYGKNSYEGAEFIITLPC